MKGIDLSTEYGFGWIKSLGQGVSLLVIPAFSIAMAIVVFFFVFGAIKWMTSAGDKNAIESARNMITHSIIGFVILMFAFLILQFLLSSLFGIKGLNLFG